ncbi:MAG: hypothetical protein NT120_00140 [Candidatus Aenigmarchaeota archaeon]|nr:hypothetical protein [Candidatus Aenigmarchaeota archaeon]
MVPIDNIHEAVMTGYATIRKGLRFNIEPQHLPGVGQKVYEAYARLNGHEDLKTVYRKDVEFILEKTNRYDLLEKINHN